MPLLQLPTEGGTTAAARAKALVFADPRSRAVLEQLRRIAPSTATVLVTGETGTGKEIVARYIHEMSGRGARPFFGVNCGAFSEQLVESELFGHERGAFTGALTAKAGWFETADRGSLFLDEIGDLPLPLQVKLLRVLQESEVVRLGSRKPTPIDVRLIAATNVDLEEAMEAGRFREDLFYRLSVTPVHLPPLRERRGDILPLAEHFVGVYAARLSLPDATLGPSARERLLEHSWPGNIRELENVVHHALLVAKTAVIGPDDVRLVEPRARGRARAAGNEAPAPPSEQRPTARLPLAAELAPLPPVPSNDGLQMLEAALDRLFEAPPPQLYERIEAMVMGRAFAFAGGNQVKTARILGASRNVVRARLIEAGTIAGVLRHPPRRDGIGAERLPSASSRQRRFRIGYHRFGLLMVVKALGTFEAVLVQSGVRVEWQEFAAGPDVVAALEAGEVDLGVVGDCPSVFAQANRAPVIYVAAEAPAPEAAAIVVHEDSNVRTVGDLKGRTVALQRGSNVHYLLIRALDEAGVSYDDVALTFAPPEVARRAFERGEVDAWVIWDPLLASIQHTSRARVLRDGTGLTQNSAYYLARREFAGRHPELIDELVSHAGQAAQWAKNSTELVAELIAPQLGIGQGALVRWLRRQPAPQPLCSKLVQSQQQVADTLHRMRLLPRPVRVADAAWRRLAG